MKPGKIYLLLIICLFILTNQVGAQKIVKNNNGTSNIYEYGDGSAAKIGIGLEIPTAKLHIYSNPGNQTLLKIDAVTTGPIGSVESWCYKNGIYYGIYQSQTGTIIPKNYLKNNLGIDVVNPMNKLDINGVIGCTGSAATGMMINNSDQPFVINYYSTTYVPEQADSLLDGDQTPGGGIVSPLTIQATGIKVENILECTSDIKTPRIQISDSANSGSVLLCNDRNGNGVWTDTSVFIINSGNVGIGTSNTKGYKLAVNGNAVCEEMKIKLRNNWPDYVFNKDYQLPSLKEVDRFIQRNNHLPELPSAKEVAENGINIGEMNALLLKKVEELTIYIIALQKEVEQLKVISVSR
ncbi:MAG: hypothetical protein M0P58_11350 [Bacteroidales bacterium]|nr:hypothetical protein [Bacteroidales bacterium]